MVAQKGKDILLKLSDAPGSFITVAGLRTKQLTFNTQTVDITDSESVDRWRELLGGAGVRTAGLNGTGIFKDAHSDIQLKEIFFNGDIRNWQLIIPDFGILEGFFQIASLEYSGSHDAEITFEVTLESAGPLIFSEIS